MGRARDVQSAAYRLLSIHPFPFPLIISLLLFSLSYNVAGVVMMRSEDFLGDRFGYFYVG